MDEELIKIQTWQIMCNVGKSVEQAKAEYAYFAELYRYQGDFIDYATSIRSVQLSYIIDPSILIEDRAVLVEGMIFASRALIELDKDDESLYLTPKEKVKQIKEAYEEFKKMGKYKGYDEFDDDIFKQGIKKYVKSFCKKK